MEHQFVEWTDGYYEYVVRFLLSRVGIDNTTRHGQKLEFSFNVSVARFQNSVGLSSFLLGGLRVYMYVCITYAS